MPGAGEKSPETAAETATRVAQRRREVWRHAKFELRREITAAAAGIAAARDPDGTRIIRADAAWRVVEAVAGSHYCLAIADVARALGLSRQEGHRCVLVAARAGYVELRPNCDDRRLLQLFLTPRGRAELAAAAQRESIWLAVLLNGLGDHEMATTTHVIRIVRQRLERDARDLAQRQRIPLKSGHHPGDL